MPEEKMTDVSTFRKGLDLERRVADTYRELGATVVKMNLSLSGQQLDVYAELSSTDGLMTRVGIDCKNYESRVGVNEINKSAQKLSVLRQSGQIDIPLLVTANGLTTDASAAASVLGVRTATLADLMSRVADFTAYLQSAMAEYEQTAAYQKGLYRRLHGVDETGIDSGYIDEFTREWFASGGNFLTILGDYGTGKTTYAERLFWDLATAHLLDPVNNRIPVFIPLKRYRKEINIRSLIMDLLLHEYGVRIRDYGVFRSLNEQGRLVIILDAFDEMAAGAQESEVIQNFREIKTLVCDKAQIVLTCRTHFFKDERQLHRIHAGTALYREIEHQQYGYRLCYLAPFTGDDVAALVNLYDPERAAEYLSTIEETYNLAELSRHPILLDMILTTVPDVLASNQLTSPSDLYRIYTGRWLDRDDWRTRMDHEQRSFFMKELAFHFQLHGLAEVHYSNLPRHIKQGFPGLRTFTELDYFDADIRTCSFLVRDRLGNYSFVHRSFCEYFAALLAFEHFSRERWPERLLRGQSIMPTAWVTKETARFVLELIDKAGRLEAIYSYSRERPLDGALVANLLAVFRYADNTTRARLSEIIRRRMQTGHLKGIDFRQEIESLVGIGRRRRRRSRSGLRRRAV
jgi:hypothetical protein